MSLEPATPLGASVAWRIERRDGDRRTLVDDALATEEPLEIRLRRPGEASSRALSLTMRTPGHDEELAAGLLYAEGLTRRRADVLGLGHPVSGHGAPDFNTIVVDLAADVVVDWSLHDRSFLASSACGVCGRSALDALRDQAAPTLVPDRPLVRESVLRSLPARLAEAQTVFARTGGLHASGLFRPDGTLVSLREDVGRHNALDKVVGRLFLDGALPASDRILVVSGRASYELLQKAARAGIPIVAAVGAPSSLAAQLASEFGITLVGFLRAERFNVYAGPQRIVGSA